MAEARPDLGFSQGFSTVKGSPDLYGEDGKPALQASTASSPAPATEDSQPATAANDPPAIDLDAPVKEVEQRLQELRQSPPPALPVAPVSPGPRPDRYSFNDPVDFEAALIEWAGKDSRYRAEQHTYDVTKQRLDEWQGAVGQAQFAAYNARRQRAIARHPDYIAIVERPDLPITPVMAAAIARLPEGVEVAHWLAQSTQQTEVERLSRIADPAEVMLEMGKLATRLAAKPASAQPRSEPRQKPKDPNDMTMAEYAAWHAERTKGSRTRMFG